MPCLQIYLGIFIDLITEFACQSVVIEILRVTYKGDHIICSLKLKRQDTYNQFNGQTDTQVGDVFPENISHNPKGYCFQNSFPGGTISCREKKRTPKQGLLHTLKKSNFGASHLYYLKQGTSVETVHENKKIKIHYSVIYVGLCGSPPGVMMADTLSFNAKIGLVDF